MPDSRVGYAPSIPNGRPSSSQPSQPPARQDHFSRPFTIEEALPYTPFTSIVPINSDIIPTPNLGSASPATALTDTVATSDFETLNAELRSGQPASKRLEHALASLHSLLDPKRLPEYKFKVSPKLGTAGATTAVGDNLSPFTKMVVDQNSIMFRYPTPDTPGVATTNGHSISPVVPQQKSPIVRKADKPKQSPKLSSVAELNRQAHAQNARNAAKIEVRLPSKKHLDMSGTLRLPENSAVASPQSRQETPVIRPATPPPSKPLLQPDGRTAGTTIVTPSKITPQPGPPVTSQQPGPIPISSAPRASSQSLGTPSKATVAIELPHAASFNKSEYLAVPDGPDEPGSLSSRKRKRDQYDGNRDILGQSLGHRERSKAAYQDLQRSFQEVFLAEQNLLDSRNNNEMVYFNVDGEPTLSPAAQRKIQSLLEKSIELNCFKQVPLDDLLHIVRLSEGALKHTESLDLKIDEAWGASEVELWLQLLPDVDAGLKAARTSLRMMCGGREDKQLYSEATIDMALDLFKHVLDGIVVPLAELRSTSEIFKPLSNQRDMIGQVLMACQRLLTLMTTLISTIDTSETVMNTLEFAASRLVFVETAHSEKDSVIEIHRFDGLRLVAMDMLSQVFLLNPAQRQGIFDDILTSLEKLPVNKQRARQFKLVDGTSIQPVSALIMRLVQSSAGKVDDSKTSKRAKAMLSMATVDGEQGEDGDEPAIPTSHFTVNTEKEGAEHHLNAVGELQGVVNPLMDSAKANANYVIKFIVNRAERSTKTGDTPYRNLLDLFVEDFTSCLNNPDWPASELLLRILVQWMISIVEGAREKSSAPAKNMALEVLGVVSAAISRVTSYVRKTVNWLDSSEGGDLGMFLVDLGLATLENKNRPDLMVSWAGPYRATLEYLEERYSDDPHLGSAISFMILDWSDRVCRSYNSFDDDEDERDHKYGELAYRLRMMIHDRRWLTNEYSFKSVSPKLARLSYAITLLRSTLCESFGRVLSILLGSMTSDQATVRSKSVRSISQVLETDPSILDGDSAVVQLILDLCSKDGSTQVRDAALGLIGKCIGLRPALEERMAGIVINRLIDTGAGVRKRAMKLAKDIYLRNPSRVVRSAVANALLLRVQDQEESVRDLARQMMEEIWFAPFHKGETSAASKISLADHVALMVQTVKHGNVVNVLDKVLQSMLASSSKSATVISEVSVKLVESLFDLVNNPESDDPSTPSGRDALQVLMIFAKADPSLFNFEQVSLLKPYIESMSNDDVEVSRAVLTIYRRVLPQLSIAHKPFLEWVRSKLAPAVGKLQRSLVDDIFACLWIISVLLESKALLARLVASSLDGINKLRRIRPEQATLDIMRKFHQYCVIAGNALKHCDLDSVIDFFQERFPTWKGISVAKLVVDMTLTFATREWPLEMRKSALYAVVNTCQSWPKNYSATNVSKTLRAVFDEQNPDLERIILLSLKEFLSTEEKRSEEAAAESVARNNTATSKNRELTVMGGASDGDSAIAASRDYLNEITRISLATQDDHALLALEVLGSINRQGIVHPKELGVTFITLETSSNHRISELAYQEHRRLHEKHETLVEREYVRALHAAFSYQRDIVRDPRGATTDPFTAKLHLMMEALKISRSKNRQKFLEKLCGQVDFDLAKLDVSEEMPGHLLYSQFLIENMAFLEYITIGEVVGLVAAAEKLFSNTGAPVAHAIESEVFQMRMDIDATLQAPVDGQQGPSTPDVGFMRLKQLTAAAMVLLSLWEVRTYLRRLYGMGTTRRDPKAKAQSKDLSKTPVKVQGVNGDKFWDDMGHIMTALSSRERMMETCRSFVDLMNVDREFKIADEDDDLNGEEPTTPTNDDDGEGGSINTPARSRKRKAGGTPGGRKKRARSSSQPRKRGRPRKQNSATVDVDADGDFDDGGDWF